MRVLIGLTAWGCGLALGAESTTQRPAAQIPLERDAAKVFTMPTEPRPAYLVPTLNPVFGTTITRIAEDSGKPIAGLGTWGKDVRHNYPKNQAWNSDGTLVALENRGGKPGVLLLDGESCRPKAAMPERATRGRWHPSRQHPNERICFNGAELEWLDVVTGQTTRTWQLPLKSRGFTEGNPSNDGRFVAAFDNTHMCIVDMDPQPPLKSYAAGNRRIGPLVAHGGIGFNDNVNDLRYIDWISVSAAGKYVIVHHAGDHPRVWTIDPATLALTPRPNSHQYPGMSGAASDGFIYEVGHADIATNPFDHDEDVIVGQEHGRNIGKIVEGKRIGGVILVRLRDNTITPLTDPTNEAYPSHASARATDRPGWVYVDYYHKQADRRFAGEVVAVKMDGSLAVERLAHEHSTHDFYRAESHVLPSRDGRRVLFASNWAFKGDGNHDVIQDYVVDTRPPPATSR